MQIRKNLNIFSKHLYYKEVPKEYFMKNKIPLIKKVRAVKIDIKKAKKEQEIY